MTTPPSAPPPTTDERHAVEQVVLLDEAGHPVGTHDKASVHHADTPLHLAFSCYLFDDAGRVLVTRRALHKRTFPGIWTNACCGHPAPGETLEAAVRRRVRTELGCEVEELRLLLPEFRYRAEQDGVVENEMCPVLVGRLAPPADTSLDPDEVAEAVWVPWTEFRRDVLDGTRTVSAWCREQVEQLPEEPWTAAPASPDALPPALHA